MMLRTDPIRQFDRVTQQFFGGTSTPATMPVDVHRDGEDGDVVVRFDLPGVTPDSIELDVERTVLSVRAERPAPPADVRYRITERPHGVFARRVLLGDTLDTDRIEAAYDAGVLTIRIPVTDRAKPRRITVATGAPQPEITA